MHHNDILRILQKLTEEKPKQRELAEALQVGISLIGNRAMRNSEYTLDELIKIADFFNVDISNFTDSDKLFLLNKTNSILITDGGKITNSFGDKLKGASVQIYYYEELREKHKNPFVTEVTKDSQIIVHEWGCNPQDLRIVCMNGEEMDGGAYPFRNKEVLVIDTSIKDLSSSGYYFFAIDDEFFVRKITNVLKNSYYFENTNPDYTKFNKEKTLEELREMHFRVIGKIVCNESFRL